MPLPPSKETFQSNAFYQDVGEKMKTKLSKFKFIMRINTETLRYAAGIELSNANKNSKGFTSLPTDDFFFFWLFSTNLMSRECHNERKER